MTGTPDRRYREISPGVFWMWVCSAGKNKIPVHNHTSTFLITGGDQTLIVDTGHTVGWSEMKGDLLTVLDGRPLDWVVPTHPEIPHSGNLARLLDMYPSARMAGDTRDFHLIYPQHRDRLHRRVPGDEIDLGRGYRYTFLDAPIRDLPSTQWGYEHSQQILFTSDGLGYTHHPPVDGEPVHLAGECSLLSTELPRIPDALQAGYLTRSALSWTRYVDMEPIFARIAEMVRDHPPKLVAPAHGNVIGDLDRMMPIVREAHRLAYEGGLAVALD